MSILNIAFLQIAPCESLEKNLEKGIAACRRAAEMGADIALFPEMWSIGYDISRRSPEQWVPEAIPRDSRFIRAFKSLAAELDMAVAVTYLEKREGGPLNSVALFDRRGRELFNYSKVHTCDFGFERPLGRGENFYTAALDTAKGTVNVGAMICYDREFPESARLLMLKGAEVILVPNACPMEINRLSQLRGRAYENMTAVATCNYPSSVPDCNGGSSLFDGVAYLPDGEGSRDMCVLLTDGEEGVYMGELDLDMLRRYREKEVHGNAYRRPDKYSLLTADNIEPPFVRKDRRN